MARSVQETLPSTFLKWSRPRQPTGSACWTSIAATNYIGGLAINAGTCLNIGLTNIGILMKIAAPRIPLRWAGSKRRSLSALLSFFPDSPSRVIEPFCGSACLSMSSGAEFCILGDLNPHLVHFYEILKTSPEKLYTQYAGIPKNPETYYRVRAEFNTTRKSVKRAAQFLYLNRNSFNGIYRVNSKGDFNVPWGGQKSGENLKIEHLLEASVFLERCQIFCDDFQNVVERNLIRDSIVYLDPPYAQDEKRVFREYHANAFSTRDWTRLVSLLKVIEEAGAYFVLSYAGDPSLLEGLKHWNVGSVDVTRNVGGFASTRRKHREFIASNLPKKKFA